MNEFSPFVLNALKAPSLLSPNNIVPPWFLGESKVWRAAFSFAQACHAQLPFLVQMDRVSWRGDIPKETREFFSAALRQERMWLALLEWEKEEAIRRLGEAGIPVMVLKGMDIGSSAYPEKIFRPMVDVDLLVRPNDFSAAVATLEKNGYRTIGLDYPGRFRVELLRQEGLPIVELHSALLRGDDEAAIQSRWARSVEGTYCDSASPFRVLCDEDNFLYLARHAAVQHLIESPVWLNDLHFVLEKAQSSPHFFWDRVIEGAQRARAVSAFWFLLTLLKSEWGTKIPDDVILVFEKKVSFVRRFLLNQIKTTAKLFPVKNRGHVWVWSSRFLLRDNLWEAIKYAVSRQLIQFYYAKGIKRAEREKSPLGSLKTKSAHS